MAYVRIVSNRVIARKLEREKKTIIGEREGKRGTKVFFFPRPLPLYSSFLLSSQLSRRTCAETLVTQARIQTRIQVEALYPSTKLGIGSP